MNDLEEKLHDPRGPSGLERTFNCAGSVLLISQCPPSKSGPDALKGTAVHWVIEQLMRAHLANKPYVYYGNRELTLEGKQIKITPEMVDDAEFCVRYVVDQMKKYGATECGVEESVTFIRKGDTTLDVDAKGSLDYGLYMPYEGIVVIDYKNGYNKVSALGNKQLLAYALGKYNSLTAIQQAELQWVKIVIVQRQNVEEWTCDIDFLLNYRQLVIQAFERTKLENKPELKAGDWCKWCPAQLQCSAYDAARMAQLAVDFKDLKAPVAAKQLPVPSQLTPKALYEILRSEKTMDTFFKQGKQYALGIMESGTEEQKAEFRAAGFTLKESLGDREYVDPVIAQDTLVKYLNEKTNHMVVNALPIMTKPQLLPPAQMENHLKKEYNIPKSEFEKLGLTKRENKGFMLKYD